METYYEDELVKLYCGDCFRIVPQLETVDAVISDPPYGTTACEWDRMPDLGLMWDMLRKIGKDGCPYVLFGAQPFSSKLVMSNLGMFKYEWIWCKNRAIGFFNAKNKPMNSHETIMVFSDYDCANRCKNRMTYNPQGLVKVDKKVNGVKSGEADSVGHRFGRPSHLKERVQEYSGWPTSLLTIPSEFNTVHPTQKPVALMEYLIRTYTNEGDTVLDMFAGSGSTLVAAKNLKRKAIGVERNPEYCKIIANRLSGKIPAKLSIDNAEDRQLYLF